MSTSTHETGHTTGTTDKDYNLSSFPCWRNATSAQSLRSTNRGESSSLVGLVFRSGNDTPYGAAWLPPAPRSSACRHPAFVAPWPG